LGGLGPAVWGGGGGGGMFMYTFNNQYFMIKYLLSNV